MKKLLSALFFFCAMALQAQDMKALQTDALRMYKNTTAGKYEALLADTYPKIFELVPKEKMLEVLKSTLKGNGYVHDILDTPPNFKFNDIKTVNGGYYTVIDHDLLIKMTFTEPLKGIEAKEMIKNLKASMKTEDVTFSPNFNSFTIKKRGDILAISNSVTGGKWKFLNRTSPAMMKKVLGEEVCKALNIQ